MLTKDDFFASIDHETKVLKHIFSKADPSKKDERPAEGIRSTFELMQYLTFCGWIPAQAFLTGDWSAAAQASEEASSMSFEEFPARLDAQADKLRSLLADISHDDFMNRDVTMPWGVTQKLGAALVDSSLKFVAAYRLQFFNRVKLSGASEMSTMDAWLGMEKPA